MKQIAVLLMCSAFFSTTSCARVDNEFIVKDPQDLVSSAELRLCHKRLSLTRYEGEVRGKMPINCEGGGAIVVRLSDGRETFCDIGYVTPAAKQTFEFVIDDGQCH